MLITGLVKFLGRPDELAPDRFGAVDDPLRFSLVPLTFPADGLHRPLAPGHRRSPRS